MHLIGFFGLMSNRSPEKCGFRQIKRANPIKGRCVYEKRKQIVEPVFGQIKEVRRFRRFSFRGLKNVAAEWDLICLTHNLLKLYRSFIKALSKRMEADLSKSR
jgi:hypothetical protein